MLKYYHPNLLARLHVSITSGSLYISPESSNFTSGQVRVRAQISMEKLNQLKQKYHAKSREAKKDEKTDKMTYELKVNSEQDSWMSPISV